MHPSVEFGLSTKAILALILLVASIQYGDVIYRVARKLFRLVSTNHPMTTSSLPGENTLTAVLRSWLAPSIVMATFAGLSGHLDQLLDHPFMNGPIFGTLFQPEVPVAPVAPPAPIAPQSATAELTGDTPLDINRPKWLEVEDTTDGDVRLIVLSSKLWSTEQEAQQELHPRAASLVRADFDQMQNSIFNRTSHGLLNDDQVTQFAIKKRYLERVEQDFGTFTAPMCRLWWQIELSPTVRTEIYPAWNAAVIGTRILAIGTILSLFTLAANAAALFAHLKAASNRRLFYAGTVTATSAAAWIAGNLFLLVSFAS